MGRTQCAPAPSGSGRAEEYRSGQESAACATRSLVCSRHFGQSGKLLLSRGEVCPGLIPGPNAPALVLAGRGKSSLHLADALLKSCAFSQARGARRAEARAKPEIGERAQARAGRRQAELA